jgi:hypothetical protein
MPNSRPARVVRVKTSGLIYALDAVLGPVGFTFGKLENYRGESARELLDRGIREGAVLHLEYDQFGFVSLARRAAEIA